MSKPAPTPNPRGATARPSRASSPRVSPTSPSGQVGRQSGCTSGRVLAVLAAAGCLAMVTCAGTCTILGVGTVAYVKSGIPTTGYPLLGDGDREGAVDFWRKLKDKALLLDKTIGGIEVECIGESSDLDKAVHVESVLMDLLQGMPISPDPEVKKLVVIFAEEGEGNFQEGSFGLTVRDRSDGIQYVIFAADAGQTVKKHELIHAVFQSSDSKNLPDFVNEGVATQLADPEPEIPDMPVDPDYLLGSLPGLYPHDGNLSQGLGEPSDVDSVQYDVMKVFWEEVAEIDPLLIYKLLQIKNTPNDLAHKDIPALLLQHCDPSKQAQMAAFLAECTIFAPPQTTNLFVIPGMIEIDGALHPEVMVYYVDDWHEAFDDEPIPFWYQSASHGDPLRPYPSEPLITSSNTGLEFENLPAQQGLQLAISIGNPSTREVHDFSFVLMDDEWAESELAVAPR